ncbi:MAG: OmpA family protein [Tunicatimonas sp.]
MTYAYFTVLLSLLLRLLLGLFPAGDDAPPVGDPPGGDPPGDGSVAYELVNLGRPLNSIYHESAPVISPDGQTLYFVITNHPENHKGTEQTQDIWFAQRDSITGEWSGATHMPKPFNTHRYNQVASVSPDGDQLLIRTGEGKSNWEFATVARVGKAWQKPQKLNIEGFGSMCRGQFNGGFMAYDGSALLLYFSETKDGKLSDLYVSFRQGGNRWTRPQAITAINSRYDEFGPYLAPDNQTMYFASARPGGFGSTDVYRTRRLDDTWLAWSKPENVGAPVNTKGFDAYYAVGRSDTAVFTTRALMTADGGHLDIYGLRTIKKEKPTLHLEGFVTDEISGNFVAATVRYERDEDLGITQSDVALGEYRTRLLESGWYHLLITAPGYLSRTDSIQIAPFSADTTVYKDLTLRALEVGVSVRLNNIFFDYNEATLRPESHPELDKVVEMLEANPKLAIEIGGHTDDRGSEEYNRELSQGRSEAVRQYLLDNFIDPERVTAVGYGETQPEVPNTSEENWQVNRRVEFTVLETE